MKLAFLLTCAAVAGARIVAAQDAPARRAETSVKAVRAAAAIVLDGRLDDAAWTTAEPATVGSPGTELEFAL